MLGPRNQPRAPEPSPTAAADASAGASAGAGAGNRSADADTDRTQFEAEALYDFSPELAREVPLRQGQAVSVLSGSPSAGWWLVQAGSTVGYAPANYLAVVPAGAPTSEDVDVAALGDALRRKLEQGDISAKEAEHIMSTIALETPYGRTRRAAPPAAAPERPRQEAPPPLDETIRRKLEKGMISVREALHIVAQGKPEEPPSPPRAPKSSEPRGINVATLDVAIQRKLAQGIITPQEAAHIIMQTRAIGSGPPRSPPPPALANESVKGRPLSLGDPMCVSPDQLASPSPPPEPAANDTVAVVGVDDDDDDAFAAADAAAAARKPTQKPNLARAASEIHDAFDLVIACLMEQQSSGASGERAAAMLMQGAKDTPLADTPQDDGSAGPVRQGDKDASSDAADAVNLVHSSSDGVVDGVKHGERITRDDTSDAPVTERAGATQQHANADCVNADQCAPSRHSPVVAVAQELALDSVVAPAGSNAEPSKSRPSQQDAPVEVEAVVVDDDGNDGTVVDDKPAETAEQAVEPHDDVSDGADRGTDAPLVDTAALEVNAAAAAVASPAEAVLSDQSEIDVDDRIAAVVVDPAPIAPDTPVGLKLIATDDVVNEYREETPEPKRRASVASTTAVAAPTPAAGDKPRFQIPAPPPAPKSEKAAAAEEPPTAEHDGDAAAKRSLFKTLRPWRGRRESRDKALESVYDTDL